MGIVFCRTLSAVILAPVIHSCKFCSIFHAAAVQSGRVMTRLRRWGAATKRCLRAQKLNWRSNLWREVLCVSEEKCFRLQMRFLFPRKISLTEALNEHGEQRVQGCSEEYKSACGAAFLRPP